MKLISIPISTSTAIVPLVSFRQNLQHHGAQLSKCFSYRELRCYATGPEKERNAEVDQGNPEKYASESSSTQPPGLREQNSRKQTGSFSGSRNKDNESEMQPIVTEAESKERRRTLSTTSEDRPSRPSPKHYYSRTNKPFKPPSIPSNINPNLPVSPILAHNEKFQKYSKRQPKAYTPEENKSLPPRQEALKYNPYAQMLITPVRNDVEFHRRLPSFFLNKFITLIHPVTKQPWLLPDALSPKALSRKATLKGKYTLSKYANIHALSRKNSWRKLAPEGEALEGKLEGLTKEERQLNWRHDMPDHVLSLIRERVEYQISIMAGNYAKSVKVHHKGSGRGDILGLAEGDEVGCILTWSATVNRTKEKQKTGLEGKLKQMVDGRVVPVHDIGDLWEGDEEGPVRVKESLKLEADTKHAVLLHNPQTYQVQMWLMKLRWFGKPTQGIGLK